MVVDETAHTLKLSRSLVYQLVAQYRKRPQTSTLLLGHSGRPRGLRVLEPEREAVIDNAIQNYYLTRERPRIADLMREIVTVSRQQGLKLPNFRSVKRRQAVQRLSTTNGPSPRSSPVVNCNNFTF